MIAFDFRPATPGDFDFLFSLKKNAEYDAIKAVFGWDEEMQQRLHLEEWQEDQPTIVTVDGKPAGSFLLQDKGQHFYFCRFFLLACYHGQGMGSKILQHCIELADAQRKSIQLCYLQGSRVGGLYQRFGFKITSEDNDFIYMKRDPLT
ncbi:GNAT family N-acetyltransferase [Vibrio coralliilyticus]|uniref:GNAT family N-acetyltransferase n=1 Tax=Vibrio TaxID=662 RepID=UPI000501C5E1|nr:MULTISPECIES: GNAT family N-acetyltransferase [Vibrio]KFI11135.1 acetyltransferase [Vibrio sp. B183]NOI17966.1 GNAT family N-acetyltransferase [Vibrio coralliilyticus]